MSPETRRSAVRVGGVTAVVLLMALVASESSAEFNWTAFDFLFVGAVFIGSGCLLELAARNPRSIVLRFLIAIVGIAAIALGEADDAPGLVLFGFLLLAATAAIALRASQRGV